MQKISTESELLLLLLRKELLSNENQDSTIVYYDLNKFKEKTGVTINEAKICISYLQDLGYIQVIELNENTHILRAKLNGSGIQFIEGKID